MNSRVAVVALCLIAAMTCQPSLAMTVVDTSVEGNTFWTKENGPYVITDRTNFSANEPGATLTIEAGTEVQFDDDAEINIFGNLIVNGTEAEPVTFTSGTASSKNNWQVLVFDSTNSNIANLKASNAEYGLLIFDSSIAVSNSEFNDASLLMDGTTASFINLNLTNSPVLSFNTNLNLNTVSAKSVSGGYALISDSGTLNIENLSITDSSSGINISNSNNANLNNVNVISPNGPALNIYGSTVSVINSSFKLGNSIGIGISESPFVELHNTSVLDFSAPGLAIDNSDVVLTNSSSSNNLIGIATAESNVQVERSKFEDNSVFGVDHSGDGTVTIKQSVINNNGIAGVSGNGNLEVDARNNYWGHPSGPTIDPMNPNTEVKGDGILGQVLYEPWISEYCESECHSNIMFLPGIMSSRLFEGGDKLWEGNDTDIEKLKLNDEGKSISDKIVAGDVIDTFDAIVNLDLYKSFLEDLETKKLSGEINDYSAVPYDWRLSLGDILNSGVEKAENKISFLEDTDSPYIETKLRELAASSKSGKVSIVAHSNGGLLTKALINKLDDEATALIDKVILVAVPQVGTPKSIGSLLHGYDSGVLFKVSDEAARDFAQNAPTSYQLLPFLDYYNGEGVDIDTPLVTFEDGPKTQQFIDTFGYAITTGEMNDFLTGSEGRTEPEYDDVYNPAIANFALLNEAQALQATINSSWNAPSGIEVHQIAGIGEDTLSGITYKTIMKCVESTLGICTKREEALAYSPNTVVDGDGTVVAPSAVAMSEGDAERWWVNLDEYNDTILNSLPLLKSLKTKHANILEVDELRSFILDGLLNESVTETPNYIYNSLPSIEKGDRLSFTLHSPLSLSAVDEDGNLAGENEVSIPGADFTRYGEVQVLTLPIKTKFTLFLNGENTGSFTLDIEELENEAKIASTTFSAIPSSTSTKAVITYTGGGVSEMGKLEVDYDGDSIIDVTYTPKTGEVTTEPDTSIVETKTVSISGGNGRSPNPQVLGASTEIQSYIEIIKKLQVIVTTLEKMKDDIPEEQYQVLTKKVQTIINTVLSELEKKVI